MKERMRSLLGSPAPLLLLLLVLMLFANSPSLSSGRGGGRARRLLSGAVAAHQDQDVGVDGTVKPVNQAGVSFRTIPPSRSNPTQNKSRPRVDGRRSR